MKISKAVARQMIDILAELGAGERIDAATAKAIEELAVALDEAQGSEHADERTVTIEVAAG
jgi:hypothetical protein